jgi:tRNA1(Val) A37 N6-methylase TrmN6
MIAWRLPEVRSVGLEAQGERAALARRSIAWNGVEERCRVVEGDLRDPNALGAGTFELITGTPPYFPRGSGTESPTGGIAHSRFEHRGGVEAYLEAFARWLAPGGVAVLESNALVGPRIAPAAREAGLSHERWIDVVPREGKPVLLRLDTFRRGAPREPAHETLTVRDRSGQWTPEFARVRSELGLPPVPPRGAEQAG